MTILARIYLVRHGETDANRNGIIQGQLDTPLNDLGRKQARLVGEALRSITIDIAYSSDLIRAANTAEAILTHHPDVQLEKHKELRERNMGDMQGKSAQALAGLKLATSADKTVESGAFFAARAVTWWNRTILQRTASHPLKDYPYHILVTSHGGFITTLVKTLTQSRKAKCAPGVVVWHCVNSSITIIDVDERQQGIVVRYGDASHLNEELESAVESNADEVQVEKLLE